jgi:hypothetical protein
MLVSCDRGHLELAQWLVKHAGAIPEVERLDVRRACTASRRHVSMRALRCVLRVGGPDGTRAGRVQRPRTRRRVAAARLQCNPAR